MTPRQRFAALCSVIALLSYVASATAVWLALRAAGISDPARFGDGSLYAAMAGAVVGAAILGLFLLLDRRVLAPAARLSRDVQTLVQSKQVDRAVEVPTRHLLGTLPEAVASLADALRLARHDMLRAMETASANVAEQKGWLEVILLDLSDGVLVCNTNHQILLYNQAAVRMLGAPESVGLGRSLFSLVTRQPVLHTLERLEYQRSDGGTAELSAPFVCATPDSRIMLQGRMALMLGPAKEVTGYVITFTDISVEIANLAKTDTVRRALTWGLRGPVASLRAAAEMLSAFPGMTAEERTAFHQVVEHESTRISEHIDALASEYRGHSLTRWPMADVYSADLFNCVARRLAEDHGIGLTMIGIPLWMHGDSHSLVLMLADLVQRVHQFAGADAFDIEALLGDRRVYVDITWSGPLVPSRTLETWRDDTMEGLLGNQTIRDVLDRHGSEPWSQARPHDKAVLRVPLLAPLRPQFHKREDKLPPRPEFYDFSLMTEHSVPGRLAGRLLRELDYVVFDTETTGLRPLDGDEIVSLAGVRVVKGRVLTGERFERLVHPRRPIPPDSIRFHGITDEMVVGKPPIRVVLPQFKGFVGDAVLVAHNAAFDLKFVKLKEIEAGVAFHNVVIDTLLLSVLIDPDESDHSLDAITQRLGVTITDRHTALGDAMATAAILVRMIDRLEARGIHTLEDVLKASNMTAQLRLREAQF